MPVSTITVRLAGPADRAALVELMRAGNEEHRAAMAPGVFDVWIETLVDAGGRAHASDTFVAEADGRLAGCLTLDADAAREGTGWPPGWAGLRALTVDPQMRRRGVGALLVARAIARARALGARIACLHAAEFMTAARGLYERFDFARVPGYDVDAGVPGVAAVRMPVIAYARHI